ncbi:MAG TPA: hypothetical protein GXX30_03695 [Firmicutes bacterium]|uniref:YIEGIA domain-containing protein n=1 Tax=Candidatus Fermentithermobacillus carboniphilus TaxID=3085328 RepID=A0AAT9LCR3_9FIRM|nr:MAG: YIEGIA domain-containing protein [Candidatus Fermentithermobacillus carboniphilus]HHW17990.1 hypothetical protein [Candidatus Fermentithermobacillaceae bacterium]
MPHAQSIGLGLLLGILARVSMLRSDYRQYPTYPHGYASHLFLGIIAAVVGSVAVPALFEREWTAVTFLVLVAQQFREIRSLERDSLKALEETQLVMRGSDYIESIARIFEARYYIVIFVAASAAFGVEYSSVATGVVLGAIAFGLGAALMRVEKLEKTVKIEIAPVNIKGTDIYVGDIFIMNVGLRESREFILKNALGAILSPKTETARDTLASLGQRQAILHDISGILGVKKDLDTPEFTPIARRDIETGRVAVFMVPAEKDEKVFLEVVSRVPVLESARGRSLRRSGRCC